MPILSKAARHHMGPHHNKYDQGYQHYDRKPDKVLDVLEQFHAPEPTAPIC